MDRIYTVAQVNRYVKKMFDESMAFSGISVRGEISNCTYHTSGHIYFTLKDSSSRISCVMFAGNRRGLDFTMSDGMSVVVNGSVNVYERDGKYQLYAVRIMKEGQGALYERLELLRQTLSEEGLFSDVHKKEIPYYSSKIGIVTAATGAAIQDIINITKRRNPYVQLYLYPALVQGEGAAQSIAEGIRYLDSMGLDVLIVGRGGGSFEDLFAFNEEEVVRAVYECNTPVISAVGHEVDTTLSDYAADMRAPTPSAAAELAVRELTEIYSRFDEYSRILWKNLERKVTLVKSRYDLIKTKLEHNTPEDKIRQKREYLINIEDNMDRLIKDKIKYYRNRERVCIEKLKILSPLQRLSGGYAYVKNKDGIGLTSVLLVKPGEDIEITASDGKILALCESVLMQDDPVTKDMND